MRSFPAAASLMQTADFLIWVFKYGCPNFNLILRDFHE